MLRTGIANPVVFSIRLFLFLLLPLTAEGCHRSTLRERDSRDILPTTPPPPPPTSSLWYANLPLHHVSLACLHEGGGSVRAAAPTTPTSIMPTLSFSFKASMLFSFFLSHFSTNNIVCSSVHTFTYHVFPFSFLFPMRGRLHLIFPSKSNREKNYPKSIVYSIDLLIISKHVIQIFLVL